MGKGPLDPDEFREDQAEKAAFYLKMHPPGAGVGSYDPQLMHTSKEWNFADLNGAELMANSAFVNAQAAGMLPRPL